MKKFEAVATVEGSPKWENAIKRERELYNPRYGNSLQRQNAVKDIIKSSIDDQSYALGMLWIDSQ